MKTWTSGLDRQRRSIMQKSAGEQMTPSSESTVGAIVAEDFRTARVFENHGIDFC
jgi:regulator of cell morphogenesis and NO signaling